MIQAIVFLPLIGALIAGLLGRTIGHRNSEYITTGLLILSAVLSWVVFLPVAFGGGLAGAEVDGHTAVLKIELMRWIQVGDMDLRWVLRVDTLTAIMLVVVNTVSALVHVYSIGYMADDPHRSRFFAYLSLFTFAMLMLVTADNFLQMFFGWEGVGLASYLLIGFWYTKPSATAAAMKAFVVNRVGDFGFALGIFGAFMVLGHIDFDGAFHAAEAFATTGLPVMQFLGWQLDAMTVVCLLLFMGAMGKSAQFLLHTWLPDAMEGPTPVSALIHAATMVTAGVFMVARLSPLFETSPAAMTFVLVIGAITAFFAATVGLVQNDIKRVIAYSTCSQLGYMFVALGAGAYSAGVFHLFTHAFFKALLFLGAGAVIHAMHHEQDMRNMGGLRHKIPVTYAMMLIGTLALTGVGIPGSEWLGFAGFFSKDSIIEAAYAVGGNTGMFAFWMLVIAALFTSFYSWRLIHLTFHGAPRPAAHGHDDHAAHDDHGHDDHGSAYDHAHEAPNVMLVPLYVLGAGAVLAGAVFYSMFFHDVGHIEHFFAGAVVVDHDIIEAAHHVPVWVKWSATIAMILGFVTAYWMYIRRPEMPARLAGTNPGLYKFLLNKWYFDELYDTIFVKPALWIGRAFWKGFDDWLIDDKITEGLGRRVQNVTGWVTKLQSGYLYHYAFAMLIGIAALLTWAIVAGGLI
ncbi:NADH-quinone oxidoreductase subunit L [Devosia neptuniae]|jgi:NADH-quinone oxidoreductase subunit L|uniref:NADH-quinone oxidoreductase subunit L n=1 Tax=Devosia TaxID=46913 RepID=UPI0022AECA46|nr:NADH-quinone oxidoreductase subunit L [Devosia neptuniae]MCZ4345137.1 NADH-quinone oxidoreductase subunit L [Devosia neptuniae]|tara:strand:- start:21316 stop:23367 length:2052 start_codon:yes stop_codon:yes gene_type:complete